MSAMIMIAYTVIREIVGGGLFHCTLGGNR